MDIVSVLFYLACGSVRGLTRVQYLVFLLQRELGVRHFWFRPGPWSAELEEALNALSCRGLLSVSLEEPEPGDVESPLRVYTASRALMEKGRAEFRELARRSLSKAIVAQRLVAVGVAIPVPRLFAYIYLKHPDAVRRRADAYK